MSTSERRERLLEILCTRHHDTYDNLAAELGVSKSTIRRDVDELSCEYPIETISGRYGGGVWIRENIPLHRKHLSDEQESLLRKLNSKLSGKDRATMENILSQFGSH